MSEKELTEKYYSDYDSFSEYRSQLIEGEGKVSEGLDKAVLAIASAGLGLTFTLFDKLYVKGNTESVIFAQASWGFLVLSVFFVLASLLISGHLYYSNRKEVDKILKNRADIIVSLQNGGDEHPEAIVFAEKKSFDFSARFSHYSGAITLFLGIASFGIFVYKNTAVENELMKQKPAAKCVYVVQDSVDISLLSTLVEQKINKKESVKNENSNSSEITRAPRNTETCSSTATTTAIKTSSEKVVKLP
ncbi:hypothetical protein ACPD1L_003648 [Vibrio cholerae]|nr:hypothetical protein [Vibrio cholerae]